MDNCFDPDGLDRRRRRLARLVAGWVGLALLATAAVACGEEGQASDAVVRGETAEPQPAKILDLVQPVGLTESQCMSIGEVTLSPAAAAYQPPAQVSVYKIKPAAAVTRESMDALADQFGFGPNREYGGSYVQATGGMLIFPRVEDVECYQFEAGGGGSVPGELSPEEMVALPEGPPPALSPHETKAAADAFLAERGLDGGFAFIDTYEADSFGVETLSGETEWWVVNMGARYQTYVDGVPLVGAGSKVGVVVNSDGDVTSFHHFVEQATESAYAVTIRPVEAALEDLKVGRGELPPDLDDDTARNITVEGVEICYYAAPVGSDEMYYRPVYVFHIRMSDGTLGDCILSAFEGSTAPGAI
jgi:hypothetical protein